MVTTTYNVKMTCGGCSNAINRIITKNKDKLLINDYNISLESQEVAIDHDEKISDDEILTVLKKSGKEVSLK
ncbi:hypothetical protein FOG51_02416 [Hanseniaspora uvarum]|nr:hypothetical protein FOG48_02228 [Hanseniaspora uvarum]KAF0272692.1 hypothetical protein FOG51_02416 [Hanseniaspora uvarum]KAF0277938.1 hypothetical protein FOG50_01211 [Hanseniaspora uvarum]GMM40359.1 hypothetical protein DAHU10_012600 [Hanseniaspora uvarum]